MYKLLEIFRNGQIFYFVPLIRLDILIKNRELRNYLEVLFLYS